MDSTFLYNLSTAGYVGGLAIFAGHLLSARNAILRSGIALVAVSFLAQTLGMLMRWVEAGRLEVQAVELSLNQKLTGWSWFVVFTQHPPWSNLYEIMVYMSWGIVLAVLISEMKWSLSWLRQWGLILALLSLGVASLTDASIKPLVPALKSWWIMIHVISASIAYAAGSLASFVCLLALMKDEKRVARAKLFAFLLLLMGALWFALGGGLNLFAKQAYFVKLLAVAGHSVVPVFDLAKESSSSFLVPMPYVSPWMIAAIFIHIFGALYLWFSSKEHFKYVFFIAASASFTVLGMVLIVDFIKPTIEVASEIAPHLSPAGPWLVSFKSHPWSLALMVLAVIIELFFAYYLLFPKHFAKAVPDTFALEGIAYKSISLSFFLMSIVLVTGALWAHYAWGRYWAWDPKETGALAIWLIYAIYLHARRTPNLNGPFSSVLGVLGFFVIIVGFLGVNLGLFADGLHTYGNG